MTSRRGGSAFRSNTVSLVRKPVPASPSMSGTSGREPVATSALRKRHRVPSTSTASRPAKRARPRIRSMPSSRSRSTESTCSMRSRTRRIRAIVAAKSTTTGSGVTAP
jgi:hypothetical protein